MQQFKELDLLWLLSVSAPSVVSQSHPDVETQKRAEISREDLEDKQQSHKTVGAIVFRTASSLKYGFCDWSTSPFHLVVGILSNDVSNKTLINSLKRLFHHDLEDVAFLNPRTTKNINTEKVNRTGYLLLRELTAVLENTTGSAAL